MPPPVIIRSPVIVRVPLIVAAVVDKDNAVFIPAPS